VLALGLFLAGYFAVPTQAVSSGASNKEIQIKTCCSQGEPVSIGNDCGEGIFTCVVNNCPENTKECKKLEGGS
jgi:hypothetical protein